MAKKINLTHENRIAVEQYLTKVAQLKALEKEVKEAVEKTNNVEAAAHLGTVIAKKALDKGITTVVFDRGGFIYQGKIQALADAAREAGLEF